jgi:hypothetical protein
MNVKQIALVLDSTMGELGQYLQQPTGDFVTVLDDDDREIEVEVRYGGYNNLTQVEGWGLYLLASTEAGIALLTPNGSEYLPVATLTYEVDNDMFVLPDTEVDPAVLDEISVWLDNQGGGQLESTTQVALVNEIGGLFVADFDIANFSL